MMSDVQLILTEKLDSIGNYETIEDAMADGWIADYGKDSNGEIYADWRRLSDKEKIEREIAELEWEIEKNQKIIDKLKKEIENDYNA